ncbi:MAG TPA: hypothetical protein VFH73_05180 [Polyangia bacterium]|nr:hypothetical protein [Polyangia bacterium]
MKVLLAGLVAIWFTSVLPSAASVVLAGGPGGRSPKVSVQPIEGENGPLLRNEVARLVRARGFHVVTSIPRVDGTAQYVLLARDHHLSAFVTGDLDFSRRRGMATATFLIWDGATGSVLGRWSVTAAPRRLARTAARGFWKNLGRALDAAYPPPLPLDEDPAPPMFIDASDSRI